MSRSQVSFEWPEKTPQDKVKNAGFERVQDDYFGSAEGGDREEHMSFPARAQRRASLSIRIPPARAAADMAFTALQYLPMPVLVLSSAKTVVLANEAMGRLLGIDRSHKDAHNGVETDGVTEHDIEAKSMTDILYGLDLTQLGLDLLQGA